MSRLPEQLQEKENEGMDEDARLLDMNINARRAYTGPYDGLWDFLDYSFDLAVRRPLLLNVENDFRAAEDFLVSEGICEVPPLYQAVFDAKECVFGQVKMTRYMSDAWLSRYPHPITPTECAANDQVLHKFLMYMKDGDKHQVALADLKRYMGV